MEPFKKLINTKLHKKLHQRTLFYSLFPILNKFMKKNSLKNFKLNLKKKKLNELKSWWDRTAGNNVEKIKR